MKLFAQWSRHWEKIEAKWRERVTPEDVVLLPGDHSWGMRLEDARRDLEWLEALPGHKVLSRGNHDYWWQGIGKIRKAFPGMTFLQNDATTFGSVGVCATRGWLLPSEGFSQAQDEKIYAGRSSGWAWLKVSCAGPTRVVMIHYPLLPHLATEFTACLRSRRGSVRPDISTAPTAPSFQACTECAAPVLCFVYFTLQTLDQLRVIRDCSLGLSGFQRPSPVDAQNRNSSVTWNQRHPGRQSTCPSRTKASGCRSTQEGDDPG